jgi:heparanase 1
VLFSFKLRIPQIVLRRSLPVSPPNPVDVYLDYEKPVAKTSGRYLSYSIDISVLAGGFWWEGSLGMRAGLGTLRVAPLRIKRRKLDRLVRALGPAYLRVGGSEADKIHYFFPQFEEKNPLILTKKQWRRLHAFVKRNDLKLIFTCKYGLFRRRHHGNWQGTELEELLEYSRKKNFRIDVFELGNELNAYWAFHGFTSQPGPKNLARDYVTFAELVRQYYPNARISGPGSAFWPKLGETIRPFTNLTESFLKRISIPLDIINWHYYPFQSERAPLRTRAAKIKHLIDPKSFADYGRYCERLSALRDSLQPQAEIWTGETGSAQCGGQPYLSDRWASSFWWVDQLGQGARLGQKVMVRQALIGGDYGLIDRFTLKPRPDYWVSWLWQQMMGKTVYQAESSDPYVRAYLHRHRNDKDLALMLINLSQEPKEFHLNGELNVAESYVLTAKKLTSRKIRINNTKPRINKGKVELENFSGPALRSKLPAFSISFLRINP